MIRLALASASLALLAACASTAPAPSTPEAVTPPAVEPAALADSPFDLAMSTVNTLVAAGNEQAAIDRLTQLMGDTELTPMQMNLALETRAALRYGEGNDVWGAIADYEALVALDGLTPQQFAAYTDNLNTARGEATSLNFNLETGDLSRTERFETLFRLGQHQDAVDYMLANSLVPDDAYVLDLFQMGYLCQGEEYGGPVFNTTDADGTPLSLQYCDFGK